MTGPHSGIPCCPSAFHGDAFSFCSDYALKGSGVSALSHCVVERLAAATRHGKSCIQMWIPADVLRSDCTSRELRTRQNREDYAMNLNFVEYTSVATNACRHRSVDAAGDFNMTAVG